ncbi:hypothetical protein M9H77_20647 [Catharanthus roseus]|uniref:Uncharacterized protein n=1 Tax=Catharanthus roseus TaxID=4058 RepID=A0ACC0AL78_CATRO|nr:hypothetical protein M9H77_20647 [Catharanthus roseus]
MEAYGQMLTMETSSSDIVFQPLILSSKVLSNRFYRNHSLRLEKVLRATNKTDESTESKDTGRRR